MRFSFKKLFYFIGEDKRESNNDDISRRRSYSFFDRIIPNNRTCKEAAIDDHWCLCLSRTELSAPNENLYLGRIAERFSKFVNEILLGSHLDKCHRVQIERINKAYLIEARNLAKKEAVTNRKVVSYWQTMFLSMLREPSIEIDYEEFLLQVRTTRGGVFEFTVGHEFNLRDFGSKILIKRDSISRVDRYGNASSCIEDKFPDLRKYCACKK